jgi:hypothetical protein
MSRVEKEKFLTEGKINVPGLNRLKHANNLKHKIWIILYMSNNTQCQKTIEIY